MKKVFLAILLVVSLSVMLHAQEADEGDAGQDSANGLGWNIRFGISFPFIGNFNTFSEEDNVPFGSLMFGLAFSSISLGGGIQYTIVPHFLAPGIYADVHFNLISWFIVGAYTNWEYNFILLQPEVRLYNQFQVTDTFGFEPFFGINYIYIGMTDTFRALIPLMNAGFVVKLGSAFGFEYCYNFSSRNLEEGWAPKIHRIGFSWKLYGRN
jgi:hypothetical protein